MWIALQLGAAPAAGGGERGVVDYVPDGDTVILTDGRHVRYIGIDAPEIDHERHQAEPYGYKARQCNRRLIGESAVLMRFDRQKRDRYGRCLAYVYTADGQRLVNQVLLEKGLAYCLFIPPNVKYAATFLKSQQNAMQLHQGMWRTMKKHKALYVGNRRSRRFHHPDCPFAAKISPQNRVVFASRWQAFHQGYAPGKKCRSAVP